MYPKKGESQEQLSTLIPHTVALKLTYSSEKGMIFDLMEELVVLPAFFLHLLYIFCPRDAFDGYLLA